MVFVHGGGYVIQSAANYGDRHICRFVFCRILYINFKYCRSTITLNTNKGFTGAKCLFSVVEETLNHKLISLIKFLFRNLCKHGVIVCVIQYRLGLLGFMSSGDAECPGNFGLYDQREAFLWIKKHIHNFGGNPNNVTGRFLWSFSIY